MFRTWGLTLAALLVISFLVLSICQESAVEVSADDDNAEAAAVAVGSGPTSASAVAVAGPGGPSAAGTTIINGTPGAAASVTAPKPASRTVKPSTQDDDEEDDDDGDDDDADDDDDDGDDDDAAGLKGIPSDDVAVLPACRGSAKWNCCDDKKFEKKNGETRCDCWPGSLGFCNFRVISEDPVLIIEDTFGLGSGELCRCAPPDARECFGIVKTECCDEYKGDGNECRCIFDRRCQYEKVSDKPLVWKSTMGKNTCSCPAPLK